MPADPPLRVALIGYGYWGPNLLRNYMDMADAWVSWVCDQRPDVLEKSAAALPGRSDDHRPGHGAGGS